jgi:hypothetical protein
VKFFQDHNVTLFDKVYNKYLNLYKKSNNNEFLSYKIVILNQKLKAKRGFVGVKDNLLDKIEKLGSKNNINHNTQEGLLIYTDFYLDQLLTNESDFDCVKPRESTKKIQIYEFNDNIFTYLKGAINICSITDKEKYLRKYMPEIINLFFKMNLALINYAFDKNNPLTKSQSILMNENKNKYIDLLDAFKNEVSINKVKIIIPQLIICYQYENTYLYNFAVELLASYAKQNIDLIAFLISSFLNFKAEDLKSIGIKAYKSDTHNYYKYQNYLNTFQKSKNFVNAIKDKLSEKNKKILMGYEEFCQNLCEL